ncbi:MAG: metallophosphoesterase [Candidatus Cyclobacteriaceae bacterium M2_1C_046]
MNSRIEKIIIFIASIGFLALLIEIFFFEQLFFRIKRYPIRKSKGSKSITILHLTDLHFRNHLTYNYRRLVKVIHRINPSIIFISGDSVDQHGTLEPLEKFLRLLSSKIPKVAVPGNHEYVADIDLDELKEVYESTNCDLLINESKAYNLGGARIMVTGLDDLLEGQEDFKKAVKGVGKEKHHFVLIHSPKHQEKIKQQIKKINAQRPEEKQLNIYAFFAGHNHGGQIKLGNYVPHLPPASGDYVEGWYNKKKPYLYLSKGFGTSVIPIRFWSRAEVTVFDYYV